MKWISVEEKLPDLFRHVIVWIDPPKVFSGYFDSGGYQGKGVWYVVTNKHTVQHITHWMEPDVPEPYVPYSDHTVAFGMALKSKLKSMEIKFKSPDHLARFITKFRDSEEGQILSRPDEHYESHHMEIALGKFINIHGHE